MTGDAHHKPRSCNLLISALGGEGGGVLTAWVVQAAQNVNRPVQATSIPGVAQRTGSTTYYIEVWPETWDQVAGRPPILSLSPAPGEVDILASTELMEAVRAMQAGLVTPQRTLVLASTARSYTMGEKIAQDDGRYDPAHLATALRGRAQGLTLLDLNAIAQDAGAPVNAVLCGLLAASGALPIPPDAFREAIRSEGKAEQANLRGFEAGLAAQTTDSAAGRGAGIATGPAGAGEPGGPLPAPLAEAIARDLPTGLQGLVEAGVRQMLDFQSPAYARLYLERLGRFGGGGDEALLRTLARVLVQRMVYQDMFRVAQEKARPRRMAALRARAGAGPGDTLRVLEFFKPGFTEFCDILPVFLARRLVRLGQRRPGLTRWRKSLHLRTDTLWGFARLRLLAALRPLRPASWRYHQEQAAIGEWLDLVAAGLAVQPEVAREIAACGAMIKGYADTHARSSGAYRTIVDQVIGPLLAGGASAAPSPAAAIRAAREAAQGDPSGKALQSLLAREAGAHP